MAKLIISTILKNKEAIKVANVAKGVKTLTSKRSPAVEEVEMVMINEKQVAGDSVSEAIICEKARHLCSDITKNIPGSSPNKNQMVVILMNHTAGRSAQNGGSRMATLDTSICGELSAFPITSGSPMWGVGIHNDSHVTLRKGDKLNCLITILSWLILPS
jgi:hypothetical protein